LIKFLRYRAPCKLVQIPPQTGSQDGNHFLPPGFYTEQKYLFSTPGVDNVCEEKIIRNCPDYTEKGKYWNSCENLCIHVVKLPNLLKIKYYDCLEVKVALEVLINFQ